VGLRLAGEPGKQSQKVHRRHRISPIHFLAQPHRQRTGEISPTAYFSDPLAAVVNGITPINSTATGPGDQYRLIGGTFSSPKTTTRTNR
jgi:hypothetical protein